MPGVKPKTVRGSDRRHDTPPTPATGETQSTDGKRKERKGSGERNRWRIEVGKVELSLFPE